MKTKLEKFLRILAAAVFVVALGWNISKSLSGPFLNSVVVAQTTGTNTGTGGVDYTTGYINNPVDCSVSKTGRCQVTGYIPIGNIWVNCSIGFNYSYLVKGTKNYCTYTGGPSGCTYHECEENGGTTTSTE